MLMQHLHIEILLEGLAAIVRLHQLGGVLDFSLHVLDQRGLVTYYGLQMLHLLLYVLLVFACLLELLLACFVEYTSVLRLHRYLTELFKVGVRKWKYFW